MSLAGVIFAALEFIGYRRTHRSEFQGDYFHDVPSDDHSAVIDFVWDGDPGGSAAMAATLMHLEQLGAIELHPVEAQKEGRKGKMSAGSDYALTCVPGVQVSNPIDKATMEFLFGFIAAQYPSTKKAEPRWPGAKCASRT